MTWNIDQTVPRLSQYEALLVASAISPEVAAVRGYRSVTVKAELKRCGFAEAQCRVPALLIPIYDASGSVALYQARPDEPRIVKGKPIKYETPAGAHMVLDVPSPGGRAGWSAPAAGREREGVDESDGPSPLPARRAHRTQKVRIAGRRTLYLAVHDDPSPPRSFCASTAPT